MSFILGGMAYAYMAFMGSYGTACFIQVFCIGSIEILTSKTKEPSRGISKLECGKSAPLK